MATNVTQKDKTLNELIAWLEQMCNIIEGEIDDARESGYGMECYDLLTEKNAYTTVIEHCREMLGYSGNMPLEVPNQSEGAGEC